MPFLRKKKPQYVPPAESLAGTVALFDGRQWFVAPRNAADGRVPTTIPAVPELGGDVLAAAFRAGWQRAQQGLAPATGMVDWIRALPGRAGGDDPAAAWERLFLDGGAAFWTMPAPSGGIAAMRFGWGWRLTGNEPVWRSDRGADNLTVFAGRGWREELDRVPGEAWDEAARWMRDRAGADPRVAAWWVADERADPRTPVMTHADVVAGVHAWWSGNTPPKGAPVVQRYGLDAPAGDGSWFAWLRWDVTRGDAPADVLGLRRLGTGVDVVWWPAGGPGVRVARPLDIERVERLLDQALVLERPPPDVEWTEVAER
jgi:hypothetical protein